MLRFQKFAKAENRCPECSGSIFASAITFYSEVKIECRLGHFESSTLDPGGRHERLQSQTSDPGGQREYP